MPTIEPTKERADEVYFEDFELTRTPEPTHVGRGHFNKAELIGRGWTRAAIRRILGEPLRRLKMRGRRHAECLYPREQVYKAEEAGITRFRRPPDKYDPEADDYIFYEWEIDSDGRLRRVRPRKWECLVCEKRLEHLESGRPRQYCSGACRSRASRKRKSDKIRFADEAATRN